MTYDFRNARYNALGSIDCEIDHPHFGWVDHTVTTTSNAELYALALASDPSEYVAPVVTLTFKDVNRERDRRIVSGVPFVLDGAEHVFDSDERSQGRIDSMATLARFAVAGGALPDDYMWHGGGNNFQWITKDNVIVSLDAPEMVALGDAFAVWITGHVFAAREIKDLGDIPSDYEDNSRWP